jgi:hypothetical protein
MALACRLDFFQHGVEIRTAAALEQIPLAGDGMLELARALDPGLARSRPKSPSEQMVRCRGPFGVRTDSTS